MKKDERTKDWCGGMKRAPLTRTKAERLVRARAADAARIVPGHSGVQRAARVLHQPFRPLVRVSGARFIPRTNPSPSSFSSSSFILILCLRVRDCSTVSELLAIFPVKSTVSDDPDETDTPRVAQRPARLIAERLKKCMGGPSIEIDGPPHAFFFIVP